jgi:hypothetical protein
LLLLALLPFGLSRPAAAAEPLEVLAVGWDGIVAPGTWSPLRVRVNGGTADLSARVDVIVKYRAPSQGAPITIPDQVVGAYGQDVALPAGTTKELTLWVPTVASPQASADAQPGTVRLLAGGQVIAEQVVEFRSGRRPQLPLLGVLSDAETIRRAAAAVTVPYQGIPVPVGTAHIGPPDVPTSGERLEAFKGIVVQGTSASLLTAEQRQAVRDWVHDGGHLVLAGGPEAARVASTLPAGTLPVALGSTNSGADLAPLAWWLGNPDDPVGTGPTTRLESRGGAALVGTDANPLVWRVGLGDGTVTLFAFDPALEPLASWRGTPALFQKALEPALASFPSDGSTPFGMASMNEPTTRLQSAVDALPAAAYPSLPIVALILGGFAFAAGPVAHLMLRRLDRRELAWLVVPGAALLLVAALYVVGIGRDGRDVLANVVGHVRLEPEQGRAQAAIVAGYFAPTHEQLTVNGPGTDPLRAIGPMGAMYAAGMTGLRGSYYMGYGYGLSGPSVHSAASAVQRDQPPFAVITGRDTRVEYAGGQWGMRTLALERNLGSEAGQIAPRLRLEDGIVTGSVRNDTPFFLENAAIITGSSVAKLGNIAPGQTAAVSLDLSADSTTAGTSSASWPLSYRLLAEPASASQTAGIRSPVPAGRIPNPGGVYPYLGGPALEMPRDAETQRRARLLDAVTRGSYSFGPYGSGSAGMPPLSLVAFTETPLGVPVPTAGIHPVYTLSVLEQRLQLEVPPGPFQFPAELSPSEVVPNTLARTGGPRSGGSPTVGMSAVYEFRPPLPRGAIVQTLELSLAETPLAITPPSLPGQAVPVTPRSVQTQGDPSLAIYNWQSGSWDPLPSGQRNVRVEPASQYIGSERQVRVQASGTMGGPPSASAGAPKLAVEGVMPG